MEETEIIRSILSEPELEPVWQERLQLRSKWSRKMGAETTHHVRTSSNRSHATTNGTHHQSGSVQVANCDNVFYTTNIRLGGQAFPVLIDTGSSDVWVNSKHCKNCQGDWSYDVAKSKSYEEVDPAKADFEIQYLDGVRIVGHHGVETLELGNVTVPNQVFAQATHVYNNTHICDEVGTLGLGFGQTSSHGFPALLSNLEQVLEHPVFGLYLNGHNDYELERNETTGIKRPIPDRSPQRMESELTFGGINARRYTGCLKWHNLGQFRAKGEVFKGYWDFGLDGMFVGNHEIPISPLAMIDSGSTVIVGSRESVGHIAKRMNMECYVYTPTQVESVACNDPFGFDIAATTSCLNFVSPLIFQSDGALYRLDRQELLRPLETVKGTVCVLNMLGIPGFPGWLLGMNFLRKYYSVFDFKNQRLGFAESRIDDHTLCETDADLNVGPGTFEVFDPVWSGRTNANPHFSTKKANEMAGVGPFFAVAFLLLLGCWASKKAHRARRGQYEFIP